MGVAFTSIFVGCWCSTRRTKRVQEQQSDLAWLVKNLEEQEQQHLDLAHWFPCNSIYKTPGSLVLGSIQRARILLLQLNMELRIKPNIQTTAFVMSICLCDLMI